MSTSIFNQTKFEELQGKVMGDVAGAMNILMSYMGDKTGVYKTLENIGSCSHQELAEKAGVDERYLREWLSANAAAGYVDYDDEKDTFSISPEQAAIFVDEGEATCLQGFFELTIAQIATYETAIDIFKTGKGRPWGDHLPCCFCGGDRFFRPGYIINLVDNWIPTLEGVEAKLIAGAKVADIGCGQGSSTLLLAEKYPNSRIYGFDFYEPSLKEARAKAKEAGITNVEFIEAKAKEYPGEDYDLVCIFDALHDMGDPVGAAAHIKKSLKPDGTFMVVEPEAGDNLKENLHLVGGIYYAFSTTVCVPTSRSQEVGRQLGAQAGEKRLTEVLTQGGFSHVRRATETPMNMVLEARP